MQSAFKPVTGADLDDLRESHGLSANEVSFLLGLSMNQWSDYKNLQSEPVSDPSLAILVRLLKRHPELVDAMLPKAPRPLEIFRELSKHREISKRRFGLATGREGSAGYRWVSQHGRIAQGMQRLFLILQTRMRQLPPIEQGKVWDELEEVAQTEAAARGIGDLGRAGSWRKDVRSPLSRPRENEPDRRNSKQKGSKKKR
jgi:transcriptional regulator with XRE-family HTH domain